MTIPAPEGLIGRCLLAAAILVMSPYILLITILGGALEYKRRVICFNSDRIKEQLASSRGAAVDLRVKRE